MSAPMSALVAARIVMSQRNVKLGLTTSLCAFALAAGSNAFAQSIGGTSQSTSGNDLGQPSFTGEKYAGTATPTPISEADFLKGSGLGFTSSSGLISDNSAVEPYVEMAATNVSAMQHGDSNLPGLHRPALPASQNPQSSVSTADAYAASSASGASASFSTPAAMAPLPAAVAAPTSAAAPVPSELIDTSNKSAADTPLVSASASRTASVKPGILPPVPSLTEPDYDAPKKSSGPLLDDDLSLPPIADSDALPVPEFELPDQDIVVESDISSEKRGIKSSRDGDFAFVTRQLDKVGVNSQRLKVEVGTGMIARPTYRGSDDIEMAMVPHAEIEYMDRFFASTERGVGVTLLDAKNFDIDVFGTWRRGRDSEGDIRNFANKEGGIAFGFEAGTNFGPLRLSLNSDYGVTGDIKGMKADLDLSYRQAIGNKFTAGVSVGSRLGDAEYIDSRFGATRSDYSRSSLGIGLFEPDAAGIVDVHGGLEAAYRFTPGLSLNLDVDASLLMGDAAASPIVEVFGSPMQWQSSLTTRYKF